MPRCLAVAAGGSALAESGGAMAVNCQPEWCLTEAAKPSSSHKASRHTSGGGGGSGGSAGGGADGAGEGAVSAGGWEGG